VDRTLVILKPDAVQRNLIGEIILRLERRGLRVVAMKMMQITADLAQRHYAVHRGKPFFDSLIRYITYGPVVALVVEGTQAIEVIRRMMGSTDPAQAAPGTIRGDFALEMGRNLIHGSDSPESAAYEIGLFFSPEEIVPLSRDIDCWIYCPS